MKGVYFDNYWTARDRFFRDLERQTPAESGRWENIEGTLQPEVAEYHVAFDKPTDNVNPEKLLLFNAEPPSIGEGRKLEEQPALRKYPLSEYHKPMRWGSDANSIAKTYDELKEMEPLEKTKPLSWVTSDKGRNPSTIRKLLYRLGINVSELDIPVLPKRVLIALDLYNVPTDGHIKRMRFLDHLVKNCPALDLYGRGDFTAPQYLGPIAPGEKFEVGYRDYKYSIVVENYQGENYFSEKLGDAFLSWTLPVYWGCTNLGEYFPEESYVQIDIEKPSMASEKINDVIRSDLWKERSSAIGEARRRVMDEYQIWPTVSACIESL